MNEELQKALTEHMRKLSSKGGSTTAKRYGTKHYSDIAKLSWAKRKKAVDKPALT